MVVLFLLPLPTLLLEKEEEAQEEEADDLFPGSQGQQASGPGGRPLGRTPSWSSHPSFWTETAAETVAYQLGPGSLLLAVLHQRTKHCGECGRVRGEQRDQLLQQVWQEHVVCEEWVQC